VPQIKQALAMALGQFLPWAASHEASRVLLRIVPVLLAAALSLKQQQQQQQVGAQLLGPDAAEVWSAAVQVSCKAVALFLLHGKWPSTAQHGSDPAAAAAAGGVGDAAAAKQLAAEQCFRHLSVLLAHVSRPAGLSQGSQGGRAGCTAAGGGTADSTADHTASAVRQQRLLQACIKELCGLIGSVSPQYDCTALQAVLLQLLTQLCSLMGAETAVTAETAAVAAAAATVAEGTAEAAAVPATPSEAAAGLVLLSWVGSQLQQLPQQTQAMVGPGVVHVAEQQLSAVLRRALTAEEIEKVELAVLGP
jgi:hypothetical protein